MQCVYCGNILEEGFFTCGVCGAQLINYQVHYPLWQKILWTLIGSIAVVIFGLATFVIFDVYLKSSPHDDMDRVQGWVGMGIALLIGGITLWCLYGVYYLWSRKPDWQWVRRRG